MFQALRLDACGLNQVIAVIWRAPLCINRFSSYSAFSPAVWLTALFARQSGVNTIAGSIAKHFDSVLPRFRRRRYGNNMTAGTLSDQRIKLDALVTER